MSKVKSNQPTRKHRGTVSGGAATGEDPDNGRETHSDRRQTRLSFRTNARGVLGHHVLFGIDPIQHRVHVPLQPRQQFRIAPHQLRAAHVQRHQLLQRHQRFVVRARPEVVVAGHPAVRLYRQLVHQRAQHAREHEQRVLQCFIGRLGALQMEQRHRVRVGHVWQLGQIVRYVPLLVQRHQPLVLLRPNRVVVDDQDHGQRVVHRIKRQYQLGDLERSTRAGPRLQMLPVLEERDEEGPILLPPVVQPAVALRQAEHRVKGRLEGEQRVLDQLRRHRVIVRHLAQLAQLNERVHVVRVLVDDAYDVLRVHALDRVEELLLHLPVRGAVLERKVDDVLVEDGLRPGGGRRRARFRCLHQVHVDARLADRGPRFLRVDQQRFCGHSNGPARLTFTRPSNTTTATILMMVMVMRRMMMVVVMGLPNSLSTSLTVRVKSSSMSALSSLLRRAELEMYLPVFFFFFFLRFFASARCTLTGPSAASFSVSSLSSSFTSLSDSDCCWFSCLRSIR
uniref:Uncharacterized protein n=1 Tax=Anopheles merus TaxID=30066 RepID=A0A182V5G9_ANOME